MILALILVPLSTGLISFLIRNDFVRRCLLILSSFVHLILSFYSWVNPPGPVMAGWFVLDSIGILFMCITSLLFFGASVYGIRYLSQEAQNRKSDSEPEDGYIFCNAPEAVFTGCLSLFLAAMTAVILSQHFGILWVSMEATTLVSAPLIYFHRHQHSLEATWKYLLICSIGIALALMGNLFIAVAGLNVPCQLLIGDLLQSGAFLDRSWMKAAFLFLFVGYATKMGLAPFHTWLPDAHSEAPSIVSALLSGALLNCAFLCILRTYQVCIAAGLQRFCQEIFVLFGLISIFFAACFILGQVDYKRMLAYSSIEHMGILALGTGLGGAAMQGVLIHAVSHSLTKAGLFFIAGNILSLYRSKHICDVTGIIKQARWSGILWFLGFFLIVGTPPSGIFLGKFIILKAAVEQGHYWIAGIYLIVLAAIFVGMARIFIPMAQGSPDKMKIPARNESIFMIMPTAVFFVLVLFLGIYLPAGLYEILTKSAAILGSF